MTDPLTVSLTLGALNALSVIYNLCRVDRSSVFFHMSDILY